jgi:replicative DNA helicase
MGSDQLVDRMIASHSNVDLWRLRTGKLQDNDFRHIGEAIGILSETPIFIDDTGSVNIMEMRTMARRLQAEHKLGLIIIDYLQLMEGALEPRKRQSRPRNLRNLPRTETARSRNSISPSLRSPSSHAPSNRAQTKCPKLSDLRESGSIEQDADVVMFPLPRRPRQARHPQQETSWDVNRRQTSKTVPVGRVQTLLPRKTPPPSNPSNASTRTNKKRISF